MMESGPYRFSNVWKLKPYHLKASLMFLKRPSELTSFCRRSISVRVCGRVKRHSMASITRSDLPLGPQYNNLIHFTSSESMSSPCYSFGWSQCSFYGFNCFVLYWVCSNVLEKIDSEALGRILTGMTSTGQNLMRTKTLKSLDIYLSSFFNRAELLPSPQPILTEHA